MKSSMIKRKSFQILHHKCSHNSDNVFLHPLAFIHVLSDQATHSWHEVPLYKELAGNCLVVTRKLTELILDVMVICGMFRVGAQSLAAKSMCCVQNLCMVWYWAIVVSEYL